MLLDITIQFLSALSNRQRQLFQADATWLSVQKEANSTQKARQASVQDQNAVSTSVACHSLSPPRHTHDKRATQRSRYDIPDSPPYAQVAVHHYRVNIAVTIVPSAFGNFFHDSRPYRCPRPREQAVKDAEHVQDW